MERNCMFMDRLNIAKMLVLPTLSTDSIQF
jgi:hypothetical protein